MGPIGTREYIDIYSPQAFKQTLFGQYPCCGCWDMAFTIAVRSSYTIDAESYITDQAQWFIKSCTQTTQVCTYTYMHICMYVCINVCTSIYIIYKQYVIIQNVWGSFCNYRKYDMHLLCSFMIAQMKKTLKHRGKIDLHHTITKTRFCARFSACTIRESWF